MVSDQPPKKRKSCEYSLATVKHLAAAGKVHFVGTGVLDDIEELDMDETDVCACLCSLGPANYHESLQYPGLKSWLDVYKAVWRGPNGPVYLYIKFKLWGEQLHIYLHSFHD